MQIKIFGTERRRDGREAEKTEVRAGDAGQKQSNSRHVSRDRGAEGDEKGQKQKKEKDEGCEQEKQELEE